MKLIFQFQLWGVHGIWPRKSHSATGLKGLSPATTHGPKQNQVTPKSILKEVSLWHVLGSPRQCVWILYPPEGLLPPEDSLPQESLKFLWSPPVNKWQRGTRRASCRKEEMHTVRDLLKNRGRTLHGVPPTHSKTMPGSGTGHLPASCVYPAALTSPQILMITVNKATHFRKWRYSSQWKSEESEISHAWWRRFL